MKDEKKAPKLRFKGFTDDWEQCKLSDISEKSYEKNTDNKYSTVLTNSAEYGIVKQRDFFDKDIANSSNISGYYVVRKNYFVYNLRISNQAKFGPINRNKLNESGIMSPLYLVFTVHDIDESFLETLFQTTTWHRFMYQNGDTGARADRFAIKDSTFMSMPIKVPSLEEQHKLALAFQKLDQTITLHEEKKCLLERLKSALSQEMFANKNGYPAVRFEGFDKAWKQSKLGEITKVIASKPYISTPSTHGNYLVIQQGDKPIAGFSNSNPFKNYNNITLFGDHTLSLFKPRSPFLVASDGIKILSPSIEMNGLFYFYELEKYKPKSEGYKRHFTILKKCKANFPTDIDEQKLIGSLLLRIDNLITKQQLKMDKLNETKESLLQNMFI
ncbi:restriction endonuclease subunit S [Lactobacillus delbrueckii subsp. allosunkii]|uniref:restriction endonuclease subunit S n=1 Tax=Lactobacillus delbrueckii TaxID=1584 RepID=UPI003A89CAAD